MKDELRYIGQKLIANNLTLAEHIVHYEDKKYTKRIEDSGLPVTERIGHRAELFAYFGEALCGETEAVAEKVSNWGKRVAEIAIKYNVSLSDALRTVASYRTIIWDAFTEELEQRQFAAITMLDVSKIIDPLLDKVCGIIGETYEKHNKMLMDIAYTALEELSVPVVPIAEGIAVIPLVGDIDTHRAKLIMEKSLGEGSRLNLNSIILDVSGVPMIDTMVADKLFHIVTALQLTGIEAIVTGIRPEIAQTIVSLGVDFGSIKTQANMQQALKHLGFRQFQATK
ncbi:STAS domain-containing protein [Bacillus sp. T33-2]|uniref:STAS domain-containing protein n=1 Tax=Bacillus sp. T33-2 TaxID=2054168 RepID=UPI000C76DB7D|nr:STAS domain-containing protein [Bacillus sp. T33-2]PLR94819.1 modulator protein [Bacillus sp. T33-2]